MLRRGLEHVTQRRDERVDAAAEVLQVDEQHVERVEHRLGRPAHFAVQAEYRDAEHRIDEVGRLDHVVLLVAAQAVLRAEGRREPQVPERGQRIERMREVGRDRSRMRQQRDAASAQVLAQPGIGTQTVDREFQALVFRTASRRMSLSPRGGATTCKAKPSR